MAGGKRIDDHSSWMGGPGKNAVFPDGPHKTKVETSAEGAGHEADYEDTTEKVRAQQVAGANKIKDRPMKPLYRN
jgi:hypothetical protein